MTKIDFGRLTGNPGYYKYKPVGDQFYCVWNDENGIDKNWPDIFGVNEPIQFIASDERFFGQENSAGSGYVRPYFRFLNKRILAVSESLGDYKRMIGKFDLKAPKVDLLNNVSSYRDKLFTQIERQSNKAHEINSEILNLLKVVFYESELSLREETGNGGIDVNLFPKLRFFGRDEILGGADLEIAKTNWESVVEELDAFISTDLIDSTTAGLKALLSKREPLLRMAEDLARDIMPLETIIEQIIVGKEFSEIDYLRIERPEPWEVAIEFIEGASYREYSTRTIAQAMTITREYILENNLESIDRKVEAIKRRINEDVTDKPDRKTIRKWIKFYAQKVFPDQKIYTSRTS
jgi:hypothetical protein